MKLRSFKICLADGAHNMFKNSLLSIASVGTISACLIILGFMFCIVRNVQAFSTQLDDNLGIVAFMKEDVGENDIKVLIAKIEQREEVKEIIYISADEAWETFKQELLEDGTYDADLLENIDGNPLENSASLEVYLNDAADQERMIEYLESLPEIRKLNYSTDASQVLDSVGSLITVIGLVIIVFLVVVAFLLITNTIKISVHMRRNEIGIMKFLGAKDSFVKLPFIVEGVLIGLFGVVLPTALVFFGYDYLTVFLAKQYNFLMNFVTFVPVITIMKELMPIFVVLSILVGAFGAAFSIKKYLKV